MHQAIYTIRVRHARKVKLDSISIKKLKAKVWSSYDFDKIDLANSPEQQGNRDDYVLPSVLALNTREVVFAGNINNKSIKSLKEFSIYLFVLGEWKEYELSNLELVEDNPDTLSYKISERDDASFRRDFLLARTN